MRLDSEGQYELVATTVGDYLLVRADEDNHEDNLAAIAKAGFGVKKTFKQIWASLEGFDDPNAHRHVLYNEGRARRGLEAI